MPKSFFQKGLNILLQRQTSILSAALILMFTVVFSQALGLVRQRLLVSIFGASDMVGVYFASTKFPDFIFQLVIAGTLSTAFIPVFNDLMSKGKSEDANRMASTLLFYVFLIFGLLSLTLFIFAPYFLSILNLGSGFSPDQMSLMANLMRVILIGQLFFLVATFFSAILQSYNHFFISGMAAALYNLGIIIGIIFLSSRFGIYAPAIGVILGAIIFVLVQLPTVRRIGFSFRPKLSLKTLGVLEVSRLSWPRILSILVFQLGAIITLSLISFLPSSGRNYVIYDFALTLAFAPTVLFGQTIAQAAFPVLSREKEKIEEFKTTFITSFNQMLYLILPVSVLFLVLRIPIVRLVYGAARFDWEATVLTGRTLAFFSLSIFAQALSHLVYRSFYALHDSKTPLAIGSLTTAIMVILSALFVLVWDPALRQFAQTYGDRLRLIPQGVEAIAFAYSIASVLNLSLLLIFLHRKINIFTSKMFFFPQIKIFVAALFTAFAIYIPIKLLDQLVFDTTRTINLILLAGISSFAGLSLYLFLTWLFNVKEASTFLLLFKKIGNWREIFEGKEKVLETRTTP